LAGLGGAALAWPLLAFPKLTIVALLAAGLIAAVVAYPAVASYVLIALTPLIVGIDRGSVLPLVRPSEGLALLLAGALVLRRLVLGNDEPLHVRLSPVDLALLFLAAASSLPPILWLVLRHRAVGSDDVLYALVLWKYVILFLIVRTSVRTDAEVRRCLWISMGVAGVVAVVAILQSLNLFGVPGVLARYYAPMGDERVLHINRGTSTLASSLATGDVMAFNLAIALAWLARRNDHRTLMIGASALFGLGGVASGQFSAVIGLVVVVMAVGILTRRLTRTVLRLMPVGLLGLALLEPVIERRISGFSSPGGLPSSWAGRLYDLRTYYWPELFSHFNFVLGVRPAARLPALETWRTYVWIESGYTWLLWSGGLLLFVAFFVFLIRAMRSMARIARARADSIGVAAVAGFAALAVMAVLMTFDAHLILRGTGELLFTLLALALTAARHAEPAPALQGSTAPAPAPAGPAPRPRPRSASAREWSSGDRHRR
jgi:hypothetical protein